jgi:hypothetical protein
MGEVWNNTESGVIPFAVDSMDSTYSLFTHRHNFAVWAAARASQRGFTNVSTLKAALEASQLHLEIQDLSKWPVRADQFDTFHRLYCNRIVDRLGGANVANVSYGRAAKLVAVYLKSMIVVSQHAGSTFANIIHPPVDRTLLQALAKDRRFDQEFRRRCRSLSWTTLSESQYFALIEEFRRNELDRPAFWMIERYWDPTGEADTW